jgi:hypothetical protein
MKNKVRVGKLGPVQAIIALIWSSYLISGVLE